ncbi:hypothetical protein [Kordia sp.]|uniref:hypothetical protein n=1 Tax=Kordia sp. TaxID=1965332 RepID=UPI003D6B17D2
MGVNITAIFPLNEFHETMSHVIDKIENQEYTSIKECYNTMLSEGFLEIPKALPQWYLNDEKVSQRPKLPTIHAALELSEGIVLRFRNDGFEIWSVVRANLAIIEYPEILEKLISIHTEIAKDIGVNECWIMGDNNPIYHAFIRNKDFKSIASNTLQVVNTEELYQEIELEDEVNYTIKGYCKLTLL